MNSRGSRRSRCHLSCALDRAEAGLSIIDALYVTSALLIFICQLQEPVALFPGEYPPRNGPGLIRAKAVETGQFCSVLHKTIPHG
jgi:hypothetical protein